LDQQLERANRVFCESTMSTNFATLVWGKAAPNGGIELCNAGHCAPLLVRQGKVTSIAPSSLPLGMFCGGKFATEHLQMARGECLVLFTDGLSEAANRADVEYGSERLSQVVAGCPSQSPQGLVRACLADLAAFQSGAPKRDDLSMMVIHRSA
jgi:sigma-B regulation protein RsbU (phosphoserine phosphatase)